MRIAFFGGTFDPPHNGHIELAKHILKSGRTDCIMFVPAYSPPHKTEKKISSYEDRLNMLKLTLEDTPEIIISDIEQRAELEPSYTVKILSMLQQEYPDDKLQLLIGEDSLAQLHTWHKANELVAEWEIITYPRKGEKADKQELLKHWNSKETDILLKTKLQMPFFEISSTDVRIKIRNGENPENMINKRVFKYITDHGLYRS
jgi:nicotinate-nucleotide adenylyltransferase